MIRLMNIEKAYQNGRNRVQVLNGVNLMIAKKEYVALVGPSGSGKSTLMHLLGCLDKPDTGQYYLDGENVSSLSARALSHVRGTKIGFVFQGFQLLPRLTALENVALPLLLGNVPEKQRRLRATQALEAVGLAERMTHRPAQLSGGQQQRVAVARALISNPPLILADEPTGNLDKQATEDILAIFKALNEDGRTVVLITHDQAVAEKAGRRIVVQKGNIY